MTPPQRSKTEGFPAGLARRLDVVCDRFESEWRAGRRPRLEDFLAKVDAKDRLALVHELLGLELHHRRRQGEKPTAQEYRQRLTGYESAVAAAFPKVPRTTIKAPAAELPNVPGYELLNELGSGGMGQVFRARHRLMKRVVALKIIRKECLAHPDAIRRFKTEVQAVAKLAHPNIVLAYDADQAGTTHFFVMEYVLGQDLKQIVTKRGPLPVAEACRYMTQLARGLQHAHENGLVHRDIKPGNLIIDQRRVLKILDLGLARLPDADGDTKTLTQKGTIVGTIDFMAPEQAHESHTVDIRADLYSVGATFYYLLTGQVPHPGGTVMEKLLKLAQDEPVSLTELRPQVPPAVAAIVRKLMSKDPDQRYATPAALVEALAKVAPAKRRMARPHLLWLMVAACLTAILAAVVFQAVPNWLVAPPDRDVPAKSPLDLELEQILARANDATAPPDVVRDAVLDFCLKYPGRPQAYQAGALLPKLPHWQNTLGLRFAPIPPGKFLMGSPGDEPGRPKDGREGPQHELEITRPFYLGVYPVTVGQFKAFVKATSHQTGAEKDGVAIVVGANGKTFRDRNANWLHPSFKQLDNHPVVCVTWNDAQAFCAWLSKTDGKRYALPTEAQWEYCCRAGSRARFHFGDADTDLAKYTWYLDNSESKTHPVGQMLPNSWGLHDMTGNVRQWCQDWYDRAYYQNSPPQDPPGPAASIPPQNCIVRGGCWHLGGPWCRSANRGYQPQAESRSYSGFRVALLPASPSDSGP